MSKHLTRRGLLGRGAALAGGLMLGRFTTGCGASLMAPAPRRQLVSASGQQIDLRIAATPVKIGGREAMATTVNGGIPGPEIRLREGQDITLRVHNALAVTSSIHWHGLLLPPAMDGVPNISFDGIPSGETFEYRFPIRQSGTYWYHSHSGFQEQTGVYGAGYRPAASQTHRRP
ncbi:MAG: FtsP/CotA-like multicopper oxidase with cupredoxin domain [Myxococcota bacterium]|jgi:FtsP/CotA-like multicopper oxidase with cupredoxin domain